MSSSSSTSKPSDIPAASNTTSNKLPQQGIEASLESRVKSLEAQVQRLTQCIQKFKLLQMSSICHCSARRAGCPCLSTFFCKKNRAQCPCGPSCACAAKAALKSSKQCGCGGNAASLLCSCTAGQCKCDPAAKEKKSAGSKDCGCQGQNLSPKCTCPASACKCDSDDAKEMGCGCSSSKDKDCVCAVGKCECSVKEAGSKKKQGACDCGASCQCASQASGCGCMDTSSALCPCGTSCQCASVQESGCGCMSASSVSCPCGPSCHCASIQASGCDCTGVTLASCPCGPVIAKTCSFLGDCGCQGGALSLACTCAPAKCDCDSQHLDSMGASKYSMHGFHRCQRLASMMHKQHCGRLSQCSRALNYVCPPGRCVCPSAMLDCSLESVSRQGCPFMAMAHSVCATGACDSAMMYNCRNGLPSFYCAANCSKSGCQCRSAFANQCSRKC